MGKRIVVGLDGSTFSDAAVAAAIQRAKTCAGTVIGVAVIDLPGIESADSGAGVGSIYFSRKLIDEHMQSATEKTGRFIKEFAERCQSVNVSFEIAHEKGVPFRALQEYGKAADLIVVGVRTFFHFETRTEPGDTVLKLLKYPVTPVLAVPEVWSPPSTALVSYPGDEFSGRALSALLHLHAISPVVSRVVLVSTSELSDLTKQRLELAERYIKSYDLPVEIAHREGEMASVLKNEVQRHDAPLVVLGAFREGWLSDFFKHSATEKLLDLGTVPLLVYQ
ncbi:MAG: universal stress protein [Calditrichaeota bacterium]|nr:universal stress protein [Calditrichota bacterium]MCB9365920.1 universal stress protein [Calditrichota bacterium]